MTYATIDGFESLTAQEVFDISAGHLLKQMRVSENRGICRYRGENGLMCAAGPFLKDEHTEKCEGMSWVVLREDKLVPYDNSNLIDDLQYVHDSAAPENWANALRHVANKYGLEYKF